MPGRKHRDSGGIKGTCDFVLRHFQFLQMDVGAQHGDVAETLALKGRGGEYKSASIPMNQRYSFSGACIPLETLKVVTLCRVDSNH